MFNSSNQVLNEGRFQPPAEDLRPGWGAPNQGGASAGSATVDQVSASRQDQYTQPGYGGQPSYELYLRALADGFDPISARISMMSPGVNVRCRPAVRNEQRQVELCRGIRWQGSEANHRRGDTRQRHARVFRDRQLHTVRLSCPDRSA